MEDAYDVACLDVWPDDVRRVVADSAPSMLRLAFASSYDEDEQRALVQQSDFVLAGWPSVPGRYFVDAPKLRLIHKWGVGYDKIDLETARQRKIAVAITAGANAAAVAEHAIALMLAVYRRIPHVDSSLRKGVWLKSEMRSETRMLRDKTVGVLGFGHIGRALAARLAGFECRVVYYDKVQPHASLLEGVDARSVSLAELLEVSDIISIHLPLNDGTRNLLGRGNLARMKHGAMIINTARGGIVDEDALAEAVASGKLFGAGLDVFAQEPVPTTSPLVGLKQLVLTSHTGGAVFDNVAHVARHAFGNMVKFAQGESLAPEDIIVGV